MSEVAVSGGGVPDFLKQQEAEGFDDVISSNGIQELRVCTKMSKIFEDPGVDIERGDIYNVATGEIFGKEIKANLVRKRVTHQLSNEENTAILCKSYDKVSGTVRTDNEKDDFDDELINEFGLLEEDVDRGINKSHNCKTCLFRPGNWRDGEDGSRIPPRCDRSHEYYVLDVTDGPAKILYLVRITESSRIKDELSTEFDNLIDQKLKFEGYPIYSAVFTLGSQLIENTRGNKNYAWKIDFDDYLQSEEMFNFAKGMFEEFTKREQEINEMDQEVVEEDSKHEEKSSTPWAE